MQIVKHAQLREFMLNLDNDEQDTLDILVKYYNQYVYSAYITYDVYRACWQCTAKQTTDGSVHITGCDYRVVRAYVEREAALYQGATVSYTDEACLPPTPNFNVSWTTTIRAADSTGNEEPFNAQVLNWLSGAS